MPGRRGREGSHRSYGSGEESSPRDRPSMEMGNAASRSRPFGRAPSAEEGGAGGEGGTMGSSTNAAARGGLAAEKRAWEDFKRRAPAARDVSTSSWLMMAV